MALEDIAGYSLRRRLGSGSAGTVWLVRDLASGRNAVLKRVPTATIPLTEELREHLTVLQRIDHPHIARLLEIRESGTEWLLFSQYVVAGTLSGVLSRRGPLSTGELVTLLSPLAEALDYLHRSGLTHGRVSPANIMFDADGRPVLTDAVLHVHPRASTPTGTTMPASPADDFSSLAALSHEAGGDPRTLTPPPSTSPSPNTPRPPARPPPTRRAPATPRLATRSPPTPRPRPRRRPPPRPRARRTPRPPTRALRTQRLPTRPTIRTQTPRPPAPLCGHLGPERPRGRPRTSLNNALAALSRTPSQSHPPLTALNPLRPNQPSPSQPRDPPTPSAATDPSEPNSPAERQWSPAEWCTTVSPVSA